MNFNDNNTIDHTLLPNVSTTEPLAYVRRVSKDESAGYAVCAADGTPLAVFATQDAAYYAACLHDLEPALLH